ncbi:MAG: erythromycin esterase family protein [Gemmatimonadaceae bacterium]
MLRFWWAFTCTVAAFPGQAIGAQTPRELRPGSAFDTTLNPNSPHDYRLRVSKGESVDLVVQQMGVDVVVELRDPRGVVSLFDSPNGRNGPESVEIISDRSGFYSLRVRAFDAREPIGRYRVEVKSWRDARETTALLRGRQLARDSAVEWLSARSAPVATSGDLSSRAPTTPLDSLAARARVIGIGEATHGSRELNDFRLSAVHRLVEHNGYRIIAIEASTARLDVLNKYVSGAIDEGPQVTRALEAGWIGRRAQRQLLPWLRQWNRTHQGEKVSLIGVDPQDNEIARDSLSAFLSRAYGSDFMAKLAPMFRVFAAADSQTLVFGDSNVDSATRATSLQLLATLDLDAPVLALRFGSGPVEASLNAVRQLVQFAEFNASGGGLTNRSRDYFMALNLSSALAATGRNSKAVFLAHNAHVAHPQNRSPNARTTGAWLREWLGCEYAALATSFGEGAFVAQIPNDPADRLAVSQLPASPPESIDAILSRINGGAAIVAWPCHVTLAIPSWLTRPHPMHWVGGLFAPGSAPSDAFRSFDLLKDFDGVFYLPRVTADEMPADRPLIPARKR